MEPYAGRPATERNATEPPAAATPTDPRWPLPLAVASLILLAVMIPIVALAVAVAQSLSEGSRGGAVAAVIVGLISALAAVITGMFAIARGRAGAKIVAVIAIIAGLLTGGVNTLLLGMYYRSLPHEVSAPQPAAPDCGIGSHPTVYGPDDRYTACPDDIATAGAFASELIPTLPTQDVTVESLLEFGRGEDTFAGAKQVDGMPSAAWVPAEVTCLYVTWDGATWQTEILGMYADGGC